MLLDNKTTVFIRCKKPMREKKGVVGATFRRPLAAECRPYVIHAIAQPLSPTPLPPGEMGFYITASPRPGGISGESP
jgi:hypothetical protein